LRTERIPVAKEGIFAIMYSEPNPASFPNKPEDVKSFKEALCQTDSQTLESVSLKVSIAKTRLIFK